MTNSPYTTNRILEIPQDIKLELSSGTLTLKVGSIVTELDGNYTRTAITIDTTVTSTANGTHFVFYDATYNSMWLPTLDTVTSGDTLPSAVSGQYLYHFKTDDKRLYQNAGTTTWQLIPRGTFPIAIVTVSGGAITSIDHVFNGFGYIGSTVFALPGVKYEYANGLNDDGTYVNGFGETTSVLTTTYVYTTSTTQSLFIGNDADIWRCGQFFVVENPPVSGPAYCIWYVHSLNCFYSTEDGTTIPKSHKGTPLIQIASNIETNSSFRVTNIDFEGVDGLLTSNVNNLSPIGRSYLAGIGAQSSKFETWTIGASDSFYTAPANGYIYIDGYPNAAIFIIGRYSGVGNASYGPAITCRVRKGETVQIRYTGNMNTLRFYYAEGEV